MKFEFNDGEEAEVWIADAGIKLSIDDSLDGTAISLTPGQARKLARALWVKAAEREENSKPRVRIDQHLNSQRDEEFQEALSQRVRTMSVAESQYSTTKLLMALLGANVLTAEQVSEIVGAEWRVLG